MVLAVKAPGQKSQPITTLASKDKALQRVQLICNSSSSLSDHTSAEPPTQVPQPSVSHQRHLRNRTAVDYDDTVRIASCPAGPGRGHKRQPESALVGADAVLKKSKASNEELRQALGALTEEHRVLQRWYQQAKAARDRAHAVLCDEYLLGADEAADEERKKDRRAVIAELVGEGYDLSGSQRTFSRHKALIIGAVKRLAGAENTVEQQQLAEAVLCHYKSDKEAGVEKGSEEYQAHVAVIDGLVETLETLRKLDCSLNLLHCRLATSKSEKLLA